MIYLQILNPETPEHDKQQEIEHFYKYSFLNNNSYRDAGLDFENTNIEAINRLLTHGLKGEETVYYNNGTIIKSTLSLKYSTYLQYLFCQTYRFNDTILLVRLFKPLFGIKKKYEIKRVNLELIFGGLK